MTVTAVEITTRPPPAGTASQQPARTAEPVGVPSPGVMAVPSSFRMLAISS